MSNQMNRQQRNNAQRGKKKDVEMGNSSGHYTYNKLNRNQASRNDQNDIKAARTKHQEELKEACKTGQSKVVRRLLQDIIYTDTHEDLDITETAENCLYIAVQYQHRNVVKEFLRYSGTQFFTYIEPLYEDHSKVDDKEKERRKTVIQSIYSTAQTTEERRKQMESFYRKRNTQLCCSKLLTLMMETMPDLAMMVLNEYVFEEESDLKEKVGCCSRRLTHRKKTNYKFKYNLFDSKEHKEDYICHDADEYVAVLKRHPLKCAHDVDDVRVKDHPLVASLLYFKWRKARPLYYALMFWYFCFTMMITYYIIWYHEDVFVDENQVREMQENRTLAKRFHPSFAYTGGNSISCWILFGMAVFGMLSEMIQMICMKSIYFFCFTESIGNTIDVAMYAATLVFTLPPGGLREEYQWKVGIFIMFCSWFQLLLHHPVYGTYLSTMLKVVKKLGRFTIMYIIFLLMFSLSFYALLRNQDAHDTVTSSIRRTWTMMIGDIGYNDIFHPEDEAQQVNNKGALIVLFYLFIFLSIIITNMWTGFIINDMADIERRKPVGRHHIELEFIFSLETSLPRCLQKLFVFDDMEATYVHIQRRNGLQWLQEKIRKMVRIIMGDTITNNFLTQIPFHKHSHNWVDKRNIVDKLQEIQETFNMPVDR